MHIVIPMSGFGERFRRAGYTVPKPLIPVDGRPIIDYVLKLFPGEHQVTFICNEEHVAHPEYRMRETLLQLKPSARVVGIPPHHQGPVYAVSKIFDAIADNEPVLINYCDFTCYWDYSHFLRFLEQSRCDGCLPSYRGFHPHMLGPTNYAFIRDDEQWLLDIQEKKPFTDQRMNEYASSGTFYFRRGELVKHYFTRLMAEDLRTNGEFYISMVYRLMAQDGLRTAIYELQHFMQWGTPDDLNEYERWSACFRRLAERSRPSAPAAEGTLLFPMAGAGSRFAREGYREPKPLIPVSGVPMAIQAAADLPAMKSQVFVLRKDLPELPQIQQGLAARYPEGRHVVLEQLTDGQARTCLLGLPGVDLSKPLTIGACDNGLVYDGSRYQTLLSDPAVDVIVWGARGYPGALKNPTAYGWIDATDNIISHISVKRPLASPATDPIVVGAFTFKRAGDFVRAAERLIASGVRVNGEIYVDSAINDAIQLGLRCVLLPVDDYLCWGTPDDLRTFEYWQSCFSKWEEHPYTLEADSRIPATSRSELAKRFAACHSPLPGGVRAAA